MTRAAEIIKLLEHVKFPWDTLPPGRYKIPIIETWLGDVMKPAIDKVRAILTSESSSTNQNSS